jgi:hypothetical protein
MTTAFPSSLTAAAVNFGTCWGTPLGQDLSMPSYMASGNLAVSEAVLRRWTTSQGQLVDDPSYGENIYDLVSADLSPRELAYAQQRFAAEAVKDSRVLRCTVVLAIDAAGSVTLKATIVTANGPFPLVVSVNAVTLQLLLVQP